MSELVVDTSAAMAILSGEPDGDALLAWLAEADTRLMSAGSLIELGIVLEARIGPAAGGVIERFLRDGGIEVIPVEREHVDRAMEGWRRFGRGRSRAALNFGDLFAYALAASTGDPVLCVGLDFAQTDIDVIAPPGSP